MGSEPKKAEWLEPYQWKPGQSGNPNGRPPNSRKLESYVSQVLDEEVNGVRRIEVLSRVIVDEMINGRNTALTKSIMDRLWPAMAQLALSGQDGSEVKFSWQPTQTPDDDSGD